MLKPFGFSAVALTIFCSTFTCSLAWAKKDPVYSTAVREGIRLVMSAVAKDRVKGADILAKRSYDELKDFRLEDLGCNDDQGPDKSKFALPAGSCSNTSEATYHFIAVFKKHARAEMDPNSKHFCQNSKSKSDFDFECPYLSKIRWLIFDQFDQTFANEDGPIKTQTLAYQALDELTKIEPTTISDLEKFRTLKAKSGDTVITFTELATSLGFYATPVIYYGIWRKSPQGEGGTAKRVEFQKFMPFVKSETHVYDYSRHDLALRWVVDVAAIPNTKVFALRKDGECCGSDGNYFQFIDVSNGIRDVGMLTIDSYNFPAGTTTSQRIGYALKEPKFPLTDSQGAFKLGKISYTFKTKAPKK